MCARFRLRSATLLLPAVILSVLGPGAGCAVYRMERDLLPVYATFLNDIRYLITTSERKAFLSTPDGGKDKYIEEFWRRRDPDPATPENELRTEYYARIAQANELFKSDTPKGWLSDRGRIYVLYGPPAERRSDNEIALQGMSGQRVEIWNYNGYEIVFRDETGGGTYRLVTINLGPIENLSLARYGRPGSPGDKAAFMAGRILGTAKPTLDFSAEIRGTVRRDDRIEGLLRLEIPLPLIWFKSEAGRFQTTFDIVVKVRNPQKAVLWEKTTSAEAAYSEGEIRSGSGARHAIEIPILIEGAEILAKLASDPATVVVRVTNRTGSENVEKTIDWK